MKLGLNIISEYITDISSDVCGKPDIWISEIRLYDPAKKISPDTGYVDTSDVFFHDGSRDIVLFSKDGYIKFHSPDVLSVFNRILDAFSFYAAWEEKMSSLISSGCTLSDLLTHAEEILARPMMVIDSSQFMIGFSPSFIKLQNSEDWDIMLYKKSIKPDVLRKFNQIYRNTFSLKGIFHLPADFFPTPSCCKNIFIEQELHATLITVEEEFLSGGEEQLMSEIASFILFWLKEGIDADVSHSGTSFFAKALDGAPEASEGLDRRLSLFSWETHCLKAIYLASPVSESVHFNTYLSKLILDESGGVYSIPYRDCVVILCRINTNEPDSFEKRLSSILRHNNYYCAKSLQFTETEQVSNAYQQAAKAIHAEEPAAGKIIYCDHFSMEYITNIVDANMPISLLHSLPLQIRNYDMENNTEYYKTMFYFLKSERNHQATAKALIVHRNTLFLRLQKIRELWPVDLENDLIRFHLLYSFYHMEFNNR